MKKIVLLLALLGSIAAATGSIIGLAAPEILREWSGERGSGRMTERTIEAPVFNAIEASSAVHVVIADEPGETIRIEADDNLIDYVSVRTEKKVLHVGIDRKARLNNVHVTVTVPRNGALKGCSASSAATISCNEPLETARIELEASSAARIDIAVKADTCEAETSSAATITARLDVNHCEAEASSASTICLSGRAASCEAELNSAATLEASELVVGRYRIDTSSAAKACINCTEQLDARASSGSTICYQGGCSAQIGTSSGASIWKE